MKKSLVALLILVCVAPAVADGPQTGQVTGMVRAMGADAMPGVQVALTGDRGTTTTVTDAEGKFRFAAVIPGSYTVSAEVEGLQPTGKPVVVSAGDRADVVLELTESISDSIVVTGEAPLVSKYDTSGGGSIQAQELEAITATPARNYRSNLLMLPGVYSDASSTQGNRPSAEGTEGPRQVYMVDGVDVSFSRWGGGSQLNVPSVAVQEMKLQASGADAEYSRTIGTYTTATLKSGSNNFHGSFEVMGQNLSWNAENTNVPEERPDDTEMSWQAAVGGRLIRDRLWFFAAGKQDNNPAFSVMASGDTVDEPNVQEAQLLKLDAKPSVRHSLAFSYVYTPWEFPWWNAASYWDLETVSLFEYPGDLLSGRWSWTPTASMLVEANVSTTEPEQNRVKFIENVIDPNCAPNQPCGNDWVYRPFDGDRFLRNGIGLPLGVGFTIFPRDQANASFNWFRGSHDLKFGVDLQETAWDLGGVTPPFCRGRGYEPTAPGGFEQNAPGGRVGWCRFFPTLDNWQNGYGPVKFEQSNSAFFARDRFSTGKWTFNVGFRIDQQQHDNDVGTSVLDTSDFMPRVSVVYDIGGNGKLLVKASGGRYVSHMEQAWSANFNILPTGRSQFEQYNWNNATGEYDLLALVFTGGSELEIVEIQPPYKDEYTLGVDWQFHPDWALKAQVVTWERNGAPAILQQLDDDLRVVQQAGDTPGVRMERDALHLTIQRRFKNNWMVGGSYTWSDTEGNCWYNDNGGCLWNFGELRDFTNDDGVPWSEYNRFGNLREDRPNMFKVRGAYRLELGAGHSINFGGLFIVHSGAPWQPTEILNLPPELDPFNSGAGVTVFLEPRGSRRTPTQSQLDMNVSWNFPLGSQLTGGLRLEVINLTDEQELIGISGLPNLGVPSQTSANYQDPRRLRAFVTLRF